jgi:hypothetical protein
MAKKRIVNDVKADIKKMENKIEQVVAPVIVKAEEAKISFDVWFASRKNKIPTQHYKEIILADMKGRGVAIINTMAKFDEALEKYGIKLK